MEESSDSDTDVDGMVLGAFSEVDGGNVDWSVFVAVEGLRGTEVEAKVGAGTNWAADSLLNERTFCRLEVGEVMTKDDVVD